jgi:AsmA family protein
VVMPKDFSLFTLRTPLLVRGSLGSPSVALDKGQLGRKLGGAVVLGLLNPFAALLPFVDAGDKDAAQRGAAGCAALMHRALQAAKSPAAQARKIQSRPVPATPALPSPAPAAAARPSPAPATER